MKTALQKNMTHSRGHIVALRMFKRNDSSYTSITIKPLSSGVYYGAQSVAIIH